jgi:tight adherence protein C
VIVAWWSTGARAPVVAWSTGGSARLLLVLAVLGLVPSAVGEACRRRRRVELRRRLLAVARARDLGGGAVGPMPPAAGRRPRWSALAVGAGAPLRHLARRPPDADADAAVGGATVVGALALVLGAGPVLAVAAGFAVWAVPITRRAARRARSRRALADEAPEIIDLIRLAVGAGLNVRLALEAVVRHHDGDLAGELAGVLDRVGRGERLADALDALAGASDALPPLIDALVASERYGAPLGPTLDQVAADARTGRRRRREEAARRVPVKLLFPLVFCTLPAFVLLTVVPVLLRSLPSLAP